jgi:L-rhamnose isomerase
MSYNEAKKKYAAIGVDTEKVIKALSEIPISMHCWQGDDVCGFETTGGASGGIQTTGNYPGKARNPG